MLRLPQKPNKEIEETKEEIRQKLVSLLPSDETRSFLYRLSLIVNKFDRGMAMAIAGTLPSLTLPGETFELLLGPWIEQKSETRFAVSPLVGSAGQQTLSETDQKNVHLAIVEQLLTQSPFPGDLLSQLLSHSLIVRHEEGLTWLAMAVLMAKGEKKKYIAQELFLLPLLST